MESELTYNLFKLRIFEDNVFIFWKFQAHSLTKADYRSLSLDVIADANSLIFSVRPETS